MLHLRNSRKIAEKLHDKNTFLLLIEDESRQTGTLGFYGTPMPPQPAKNFPPKHLRYQELLTFMQIR